MLRARTTVRRAPASARFGSMFAEVCRAAHGTKPELSELYGLKEPAGPFTAGQHLFRSGDPFRALWVVRTGTVKTSRIDLEGREQVLAFVLPGDVVGLDAIYPGRYPCDAVALERTECCRFPFRTVSALALRRASVRQALLRLLSKALGAARRSAGNFSAAERVAAFLLDLDRRSATSDPSGSDLYLRMTRGDIAGYLRLAPETISRVLARFRTRGFIGMDGRRIELLQPRQLGRLARCVFDDPASTTVPPPKRDRSVPVRSPTRRPAEQVARVGG